MDKIRILAIVLIFMSSGIADMEAAAWRSCGMTVQPDGRRCTAGIPCIWLRYAPGWTA